MKKLIIYSFLSLIVLAACRKSDNERVPEFTKVPLPQLKKVSGSATISDQEPNIFSAKFNVGLFFPDGDKPAKLDVVVRKNANNNNTKVLKTDVTSYPTELTITGPQLIALFGVIKGGDVFEIGADVTLNDGRKFLAFPIVGAPFGAGSANVAGSTPTVTYEAICAFTMSAFGDIGTEVAYTVLEDRWQDYEVGSTVMVKIIDGTHMSFKYPAANAKPIVIAVNPVGNVTSVAKVDYGSYGGTPYAASSDPTSTKNVVAPCAGTITVALLHYEDGGDPFGPYVISLKRK